MKNKIKKEEHCTHNTALNSTQYINVTKIEDICLLFFGAFLVLFIWGYYIKNDALMFLGAGMEIAGSTIQTHINLSNEED